MVTNEQVFLGFMVNEDENDRYRKAIMQAAEDYLKTGDSGYGRLSMIFAQNGLSFRDYNPTQVERDVNSVLIS